MALAPLARRSAELSDNLSALGEHCEHEETRNEIIDIARETFTLSTTLSDLHNSVEADKDSYTEAFRDDLEEITTELSLVFDEIAECCAEMQKADTPHPVIWFFRKGRVAKLQKHLVALKTTVVVMRTVLHHGRNYGVQSSPGRLAESAPHTLYEDRAILDSVFAKNRHAIADLHSIERDRPYEHSSSTSSDAKATPDIRPGAHGRNLSNATGVDASPIADVLPPHLTTARKSTELARSKNDLQRRFSKRGVRLGVHASILDMGAHETTEGLRKRWLQAASSAQTSDSSHHKRMTTISEDGAALQISTASNNASEGTGSSEYADVALSPDNPPGRRRANSLKLIGSPMGSAMSRLIKKLSFSNDDSTACGKGEAIRKLADQSFTKRISDCFRKPEITTPEWNQEFENGCGV